MKKTVIILSFIMSMIMFASCGNNTTSEKHDFLNIDIGMSTIELFEIEGKPDSEISSAPIASYCYYSREAFGVANADITYFVDEDGITGAMAVYKNTYADNKSYQIEYQTIKENLITEWGEPTNIAENDEEFNYSCGWDNKYLDMYREEDNSVKLWVRIY